MTIDEMITELERRREMHGGSTEVRTTWEGQSKEIAPKNIYFHVDKQPILWIDADDNQDRPNDAI